MLIREPAVLPTDALLLLLPKAGGGGGGGKLSIDPLLTLSNSREAERPTVLLPELLNFGIPPPNKSPRPGGAFLTPPPPPPEMVPTPGGGAPLPAVGRPGKTRPFSQPDLFPAPPPAPPLPWLPPKLLDKPLRSLIRCFVDFNFVPFVMSPRRADRPCWSDFDNAGGGPMAGGGGGPGGGGGGGGPLIVVIGTEYNESFPPTTIASGSEVSQIASSNREPNKAF